MITSPDFGQEDFRETFLKANELMSEVGALMAKHGLTPVEAGPVLAVMAAMVTFGADPSATTCSKEIIILGRTIGQVSDMYDSLSIINQQRAIV